MKLSPARLGKLAAALVILAVTASTGCRDNSAAGVVTITCGTCQESPTDPFLQYNFEAATRFNEANAGRYRIEMLENQNAGSGPDRLQYYQRLALADDLPDLFQLNSAELGTLAGSGKLRDFTADLESDSSWRESFKPGVFEALRGPDGETWAIPQQRDAIGVFYNKDLYRSAGYDTFPETWQEFERAAATLKDQGKTALAADGDWATMLMWVHLIGTQPGGAEFLTQGVARPGYERVPEVIRATETLKRWHTEGWVNSDSFSGDFQDAAAAYLSQSAATVANGPWFVKTTLASSSAPEGLYRNTGYTLAPGWSADGRGVVEVTGAGWASGAGADDKEKSAAVQAFLRFVASPEETLTQAEKTGANPPVTIDPARLKTASLEPLSVGLIEQASKAKYRYPHVRVHGPTGFGNAWKNLWPAYVRGGLDTHTFLTRLGTDARAKIKSGS